MLILAIILLVVQVVVAMIMYLLLAVGAIDTKKVMAIIEWFRALFIKVVLYVVRKPLPLQVVAVAFIAMCHQAYLMLLPPVVMLNVFMSTQVEEKLVAMGLSELGDSIMEFVKVRTWLKIVLIPVVVYAVVTTFVITASMHVITDPHTSSSTLMVLCVPVCVSLAIWHAESVVPNAVRVNLLGTVDERTATELPSSGAKRKVLVVAAGTVVVMFALVVGTHFYIPRLLQMLMGAKLDPSLYLAGVTAAVLTAAGMVSIQFDGQTQQITSSTRVAAPTNDWDSNSIYSYYHSMLCMTCIIALAAFICFPLFNNPYFCYRTLTTSVV